MRRALGACRELKNVGWGLTMEGQDDGLLGSGNGSLRALSGSGAGSGVDRGAWGDCRVLWYTCARTRSWGSQDTPGTALPAPLHLPALALPAMGLPGQVVGTGLTQRELLFLLRTAHASAAQASAQASAAQAIALPATVPGTRGSVITSDVAGPNVHNPSAGAGGKRAWGSSAANAGGHLQQHPAPPRLAPGYPPAQRLRAEGPSAEGPVQRSARPAIPDLNTVDQQPSSSSEHPLSAEAPPGPGGGASLEALELEAQLAATRSWRHACLADPGSGRDPGREQLVPPCCRRT